MTKTAPAAAALKQEYQIHIADAIQARDYERACELYREYQNPYLREFKDFLAVKEFTEYAESTGLFKQEMAGKIAEEQKFLDSARASRNYETTSLKQKGTASVDNLLSAKYNFRTIKGKHDILKDIGTRKIPTCNPKFSKGGDFANNCGYCSVAYEMRRRGYDVIANPQNTMLVADWLRLFENTVPLDLKSKQTDALLNELNEKLSSLGNGARGSLFVKWKGRQVGHFFSWEVKDNKVFFIDAQNGNMDAQIYFSMIWPNSVICVRWDDLNPSALIKDACKNRGGNS